ncbi:MAG: SDR family oxidoreductase [Pseudomonadota bacterium]
MTVLDGQVAIVTGAASGIGRAAALKLAAAGATILATDIDSSGAKKTADMIVSSDGRCETHQQDVTEEDTWDAVFEKASSLGTAAVLVNNAGIAVSGSTEKLSLEDWQRQMAVNLDSVFLGTRAAIRTMKATGGGSIINISSVAGLRGAVGLSAYCASKGGVRLFSKAAAVEAAQLGYNVRVNSVHPGIIETPIWQKSISGITDVIANEDQLNAITGGVGAGANAIDAAMLGALSAPMQRAGTPDEVGDLIVFLASPASSYITGQEFVIDGGMTAGG